VFWPDVPVAFRGWKRPEKSAVYAMDGADCPCFAERPRRNARPKPPDKTMNMFPTAPPVAPDDGPITPIVEEMP
jgi:hypothetical protein